MKSAKLDEIVIPGVVGSSPISHPIFSSLFCRDPLVVL